MKKMAIVVVLIGVVAVVLGGVFIGMGVAKNNQLVGAMRVEKVALPLVEGTEPSAIDSAGEAQAAGDIIREHRRGIAPSYQELLGDGRFDPTNPEHLTYAQAMNMENYLYLAVIGFGLIQATVASGVFMVITGVALGSTGVMLYRVNHKLS
ncbi:MAG TPA: hypothetical protein VMW00_01435 [Dehalococcoidales bacterium]|nr:hypothetical protein [Dehalococcoidales bacterium]